MKMLPALTLSALLGVTTVYGQGLTLNSGDTWSYEFTSLTYEGVAPFASAPYAVVYLNLSGYDTNTESVVVKMYENGPTETPVQNIFPTGAPAALSFNTWQDSQGWVQLEVVNGSVTLDSAQFTVFKSPDGVILDRYSQTVVVPEPSVFALLGVSGVLATTLGTWKMRARSQCAQ